MPASVVRIIPNGEKKIFSYEEACELLPLIRRITAQSEQELKRVIAFMKHAAMSSDRKRELQSKADEIVFRWSAKVSRTGAVVKGLWIVDFDMGEGYYCWKYNEETISHWHGYNEGFSKRVPLDKEIILTT